MSAARIHAGIYAANSSHTFILFCQTWKVPLFPPYFYLVFPNILRTVLYSRPIQCLIKAWLTWKHELSKWCQVSSEISNIQPYLFVARGFFVLRSIAEVRTVQNIASGGRGDRGPSTLEERTCKARQKQEEAFYCGTATSATKRPF